MVGPVRGVAFDFNGTLSDDEALLYEIFADLFAEHLDWRMSRADYLGRLAGLSDPEIVGAVIREHGPTGGPLIAETLLALRGERYRDRVTAQSPVRRQTVSLVRALRERAIPLAVVTGAQRADVDHVLRGAGIAGCFAVVVAAEDVDRGKPAPDGYLRAAESLAVPPADLVALEDSVVGVRAARAAGMRCVAVTGTHARTVLAREGAMVVDALTPRLLEQLGRAGLA